MNILAIGNSFSQDATRYLHQIARADGKDVQVVNLYIGGCDLSLHFRNMQNDSRAYTLECNGMTTGFKTTIKEALLNRNWDVVTFQQVSHLSPYYETFQPYLKALSDYVRQMCPKAKLYMHQTWAYEDGSERLTEKMGYKTAKKMFKDIEGAYAAATQAVGAGIIPSGELFSELVENGMQNLHRDTFHASCGLGRYALGLLWYKVLTGTRIGKNTFSDFDEPITDEEIEIVKKYVEGY